jgi:hypothetical protein
MRFTKRHDCMDAGGRATQEQLPGIAVLHSEAARRARHMDVPSASRDGVVESQCSGKLKRG